MLDVQGLGPSLKPEVDQSCNNEALNDFQGEIAGLTNFTRGKSADVQSMSSVALKSQIPFITPIFQFLTPQGVPVDPRLSFASGVSAPFPVAYPGPVAQRSGEAAELQRESFSHSHGCSESKIISTPQVTTRKNFGEPSSLGGRQLEAPKLAPRPPGMLVAQGTWQWSSMYGPDQPMMSARFEALEKERRAEERRKKNRQAAARSNARKKCVMDGIRSEINKSKKHAEHLRTLETKLKHENRILKIQCTGEKLRCK